MMKKIGIKMLSFKQYLQEDKDLEETSPEEAARIVAKECSEFIKEVGIKISDSLVVKNGLYRAVGKMTRPITKSPGNVDREPRDSSEQLHKVLDNYLSKKFGFPYRSKGTFVSNKPEGTESYGTPNLFFPVNGYRYVYSKQINDAFVSFQNISGIFRPRDAEMFQTIIDDMHDEVLDLLDEHLQDEKIENIDSLDMDHELEKFIDAFKFGNINDAAEKWFYLVKAWLNRVNPYTDKNLSHILSMGHLYDYISTEIMFDCKSYYLISLASRHSQYTERFLRELKKLL